MKAVNIMITLVLIDMIGVGLVLPSLPSLATSIGLNGKSYGLVGTFYGLGQLVGGLTCGSLSDQIGRKHVLLLSFAGSALFYGGLSVVGSLWTMLFCRFGVGLVKQTVTVSQAYISDFTTRVNRTQYLGWNGMAMGIGFIIGPVAGSIIAHKYGRKRLPFLISAIIFSANLLAAWLWLPKSKRGGADAAADSTATTDAGGDASAAPASDDTTTNLLAKARAAQQQQVEELAAAAAAPVTASTSSSSSSSSGTTITAPHAVREGAKIDDCPAQRTTASQNLDGFLTNLKNTFVTLRHIRERQPVLLRVFLSRFMSNATVILIESVLLLYLQNEFQLDSKRNGYVIGFIGIFGVLTNSLLIAPLVARFGDTRALVYAYVIGGVCTVMTGYAPSLTWFLVGMAGVTVCQSLNRTCITSLFTLLTPLDKRGTYLGLAGSLDSLARVLLPVIGGFCLDASASLPFLLAGATLTLLGLNWYLDVGTLQASIDDAVLRVNHSQSAVELSQLDADGKVTQKQKSL